MKRTSRALVALGLALPLLGVGTSAVHARVAPTPVDLKLNTLPRGDAPKIPYVQGRTLIDGDVRVALPRSGAVLGSEGGDNIVLTYTQQGSVDIRRVSDAGAQTVLATGDGLWEAVLSEDGTSLARTAGNRKRTTITLTDTRTGAVTSKRTFDYPWLDVETVAGTSVLVSSFTAKATGTWLWETAPDTFTRLSKRPAYWGDLTQDRFAYFTKDIYQGGCSVLAKVSAPRKAIWKSCREAVVSLAPGGRRMVTFHLLTDGLGPGAVWIRNGRGRLKAELHAPLVFGRFHWEDGRTLLTEVHTRSKRAYVRCVDSTCERAGKVSKSDLMMRTALRRAMSGPLSH